MGIHEVIISPRSPWQNPYAERVIGSIRRECLDRVIVLGEDHLYRILTEYVSYYNRSRTHLSLDGNAPLPRKIESPASATLIIARNLTADSSRRLLVRRHSSIQLTEYSVKFPRRYALQLRARGRPWRSERVCGASRTRS